MLKDECIVIFGSNYWDGPPGTPRQITEVLAGSNRILYVEPPASYIHLREFARNRVWYRWMFGVRQEKPSLLVYTPPPSLPWKTRWHLSNDITQRYLAPFLRRVMERTGMHHPILLTFLPHHYDLVERLPHRLICYYCVDEWTALSKFVNPPTIRSYEDHLATKADLIFATARSLADRLRHRNPETYLVPNGTNFELYHRACDPKLSVPADLQSIPRPILGFSGLFDFRLDQSLLSDLARAKPEWSFVFVGSRVVNTRRLREFPNVHFLGSKPVGELPAYFKAFDVALIPYELNAMTVSIYPAKLNEYLAAGLPVVATRLPELINLDPMVRVADSSADFLRKVERALIDDCACERQARIEFARKNTWEERAETISHCILQKLRRNDAQAACTASM